MNVVFVVMQSLGKSKSKWSDDDDDDETNFQSVSIFKRVTWGRERGRKGLFHIEGIAEYRCKACSGARN